MLLVEPCSVAQLEALAESAEVFTENFRLPVAPDLEFFPEMLAFSIKALKERRVARKWWTHLFILEEPRIVVGIGGYKGNPNRGGVVEIGYSVAPSYEGRGLATEAAQILIERAFASDRVRVVRAHTLPSENASTSILKKVGMTQTETVQDGEDGPVWRWEKRRA